MVTKVPKFHKVCSYTLCSLCRKGVEKSILITADRLEKEDSSGTQGTYVDAVIYCNIWVLLCYCLAKYTMYIYWPCDFTWYNVVVELKFRKIGSQKVYIPFLKESYSLNMAQKQN